MKDIVLEAAIEDYDAAPFGPCAESKREPGPAVEPVCVRVQPGASGRLPAV